MSAGRTAGTRVASHGAGQAIARERPPPPGGRRIHRHRRSGHGRRPLVRPEDGGAVPTLEPADRRREPGAAGRGERELSRYTGRRDSDAAGRPSTISIFASLVPLVRTFFSSVAWLSAWSEPKRTRSAPISAQNCRTSCGPVHVVSSATFGQSFATVSASAA